MMGRASGWAMSRVTLFLPLVEIKEGGRGFGVGIVVEEGAEGAGVVACAWGLDFDNLGRRGLGASWCSSRLRVRGSGRGL